MKSTGIVRKVDELGRIVLPKELRTILGINEKDTLEVFVDDGKIVLQRYEPACVFCNGMNYVSEFSGHGVCRDCMTKVAARLE